MAEVAAKKIESATADAANAGRAKVDEGARVAQKSFEDMATFGQGNVDALMKAQSVAAKAAEEINAELVAYSKKSMEESVAHAKNLAASKTLTELMDKQASFMKLSLDGVAQQSAKVNELMLDAARGVMEPLTRRMNDAAETAKGRVA
jgi:phasin family protein